MKNHLRKIHWECVRECEEDARLIFEWRNDPITRQMSFHTHLQNWGEFFPRFLHSSFFPDLFPLFAVVSGERVAWVGCRPANHPTDARRRCCNLSINVAPKHRGKGYGSQILIEIQEWIRQRGYDTVLAEVKEENGPSVRSFEKAGFVRYGQINKFIEDTGETVPTFLYKVELSPESPFKNGVLVVAEAGSNWRMGNPTRDFAMAKSLIEAAAEAGADAVKFQVFHVEEVYVPDAGVSDYLAEGGIKEDITDIYKDLTLPHDMIPKIADYCRQCHVDFMASPFSISDFEAIDPFVKVHKIASYEIGHIHLLEKAAKSGKPVLMSTGCATEEEIGWSVNYMREQGVKQLILLQCTAAYPAKLESVDVSAIPWLKDRYKAWVGLSDHSRHPTYAPAAAVALGAIAIEKHFTLSNDLPGPDHYFSLTPPELKQMIEAIRSTYIALGSQVKKIEPCEEELRSFAKRGVQAIRDIAAGELLEEGVNVAILRPGKQLQGMHPRNLLTHSSKRFIRPVANRQGVHLNDLEE